jgi:protease I
MSDHLSGKRVAFLATDGVERVELVEPWSAVDEAGGTAELISIHGGEIQGVDGMDKADTFRVSRTVERADEQEFDALVLPGGVANPDKLRRNEIAVAFVRSFFQAGKPIAAICHAPWMLVEADIVRGRTLTSYPSLRTDIRNAGGTWVDEEVHLEERVVTSRSPRDLPAFCAKLLEQFHEGVVPGQRAATG